MFPLQKLPMLVRLEILDRFTITEITRLHMSSEEGSAIVKESRRKVKIEWLLDVNSEHVIVVTEPYAINNKHDFEDPSIAFRFKVPRYHFPLYHGLHAMPILFVENGNSTTISYPKTDSPWRWAVLKQASDLLVKTFKVQDFSIRMRPTFAFNECPIWSITRKFSGIYIDGDTAVKDEQDPEFARQVVENLESPSLFISTFFKLGYTVPSLPYQKLIIDGNLITIETILNTDCPKIIITRCRFSEDELNKLMKHWISEAGLDKLRWIICTFQKRPFGIPRKVLKDIQVHQCLPALMPSRVRQQFPNSRAVNVPRKDGKTATLSMNPSTFSFYIS